MSIEKSLVKRVSGALLYEETKCFYHDLDPRSKLMYLVSVFAMISTTSILKLLLALSFVYALGSLCPRIYRRTCYVLIGLAPLVALTALFVVVFTVIFSGSALREVVLEQVKVFIRIAIVALAITSIALSTTPHEFVHALVKLGFKYTYLYALVIAVRFIPLVFSELSSIYDAQRSRGLELEKGRVVERLRKLNAILIPVFVCSLLRARDLVEALELKGFGYSNKRTFYRNLKFKKIDVLFTTLTILLALIIHLFIP